MRSRIKRMCSSILMRLVSPSIWRKKLHAPSASSRPAALYRTCSSLPLDRFITILTTSDLTPLIIYGEPSLADISEAWANIYAEYMDINDDNEGVYILRLQSQIALLKNNLIEIETALYCLTLEYRQDLIDILEDHGITIAADPSDFPAYLQAIESADASLAFARLQLETLTNEYIQYENNRQKQTVDKAYFMMTLRRLARFNHVVVIKPESITVEEFVMMVRDYFEYLSKNQKQMEPDGY